MSKHLVRRVPAGLLAAVATLAVFSCTPEEEHRVLTFFFDGVPPLHPPDQEARPPGEPESKSPGVVQVERPPAPKVVRHQHEPYQQGLADRSQCGACHDLRGSMRLVKPIEALCLTCHEEKTRELPRMHGPVAVGQCALCHEEHDSPHRHLVRDFFTRLLNERKIHDHPPTQKLCLQCHEPTVVTGPCRIAPSSLPCFQCHEPTRSRGTTLGCKRASDVVACTECHNPHGGQAAFFPVERSPDAQQPGGPSAPPSPEAP